MKEIKVHNIVVIDSNFILLPYQFKIDYLNEIYLNLEGKTRFYVFKQNLNELEAKTRKEPRARKFHRQYKSGLSYLEKKESVYPIYFIDEIKENNETTDDFLLRWCVKFKKEFSHVFLATNDSELRKKAKKSKINVIYLRQKKLIDVERA
ncbi:MAG TPA: PIN domain-containing protein [Candidatus Lokiarchaeia archaeon]